MGIGLVMSISAAGFFPRFDDSTSARLDPVLVNAWVLWRVRGGGNGLNDLTRAPSLKMRREKVTNNQTYSRPEISFVWYIEYIMTSKAVSIRWARTWVYKLTYRKTDRHKIGCHVCGRPMRTHGKKLRGFYGYELVMKTCHEKGLGLKGGSIGYIRTTSHPRKLGSDPRRPWISPFGREPASSLGVMVLWCQAATFVLYTSCVTFWLHNW
jgi:hypothetical protein